MSCFQYHRLLEKFAEAFNVEIVGSWRLYILSQNQLFYHTNFMAESAFKAFMTMDFLSERYCITYSVHRAVSRTVFMLCPYGG